MSDNTPTKVCTGPCGRELPDDDKHFYRQRPYGLTPRCRGCISAANAARRAAERERRAAEPPRPKRCVGPCGRELPADAKHFARDPLDRPRPRCRECELAAELAADAESAARQAASEEAARVKAAREVARARSANPSRPARLPATPEEAAARVKAAVREFFDREAAAAYEGLEAVIVELTGGPPLPVTFQTTEGRRNFIRNCIATAPPGRAPEAAARARRIMAAARASADAATAPPDLGPLIAALSQQELGGVS